MTERMRRTEREQMILLYAMQMLLENARDSLQKTLTARTRTGWRDMRLAETLLDKTTRELLESVPQDQLRAIYADVKNSTINIRVKAATPSPDSVWHLETGQIATLVNLPIEITGDMLSAYMACADRLEVRENG